MWVGDSIVAKPRLDALTTLAYVAGITSRVRLGTAVLLPALRHPVVLAHQLANADQISRGRLVVGVGVGWGLPSAEREWAACGMDHKRRPPPGGAHRDLADAVARRAVYSIVRLDDDVARAEQVTSEFLARYYGGGVKERGLLGLGPAPLRGSAAAPPSVR